MSPVHLSRSRRTLTIAVAIVVLLAFGATVAVAQTETPAQPAASQQTPEPLTAAQTNLYLPHVAALEGATPAATPPATGTATASSTPTTVATATETPTDTATATPTSTATATPMNQPPQAINDIASVSQGMTVTVNVLANDSDPDNGLLVITGLAQPKHGSVAVRDQLAVYEPVVDFSGSDVFTYTISDSQGGAASAIVNVSVFSDTLASTEWIESVDGGVIEAGSSTLIIPSGAITASTFVTVSELITGMTMQADGMKAVSLEPSGLQFSQPATLTISYGDTGSYDEDLLEVVAFNDTTNEWEPQEIVNQDKVANTVSVQADHFSDWFAYIADPLYVVMEIPGKFLKPGHVLVRMDGNYPNCNGQADWFPGHTGIFSHAIGSDVRIIEANVGGEFKWGCLAQGDVHVRSLDEYITESCGFYMGAMYRAGASDTQMNSAVTEAQSQLGKGYLVIGQGNWQTNCFSCVGLVEYAYDQVGASIVPDSQESLAITPLQQYRRLRPVDEISVGVGEQIRIPVDGIYRVQVPFGHDYYAELLSYPSADSLPNGSTYSGGVFEWTPQRADGGKSFTVQFQVEANVAGVDYVTAQNLTIHVSPAPNEAPVANDDAATTSVATAVTVDVLVNDSDPDGDSLTITSVSMPAHGNAVIEGQSIRYTPAAGYSGGDSFTYTISDGSLTSTASVNVTVSAMPPVIGNVFVDFSHYTQGVFPIGWSQFGSGQITPRVQESGGSGSAFHVLDFPKVNGQYWDTFAIHDGIIASDTYTVQVKLRFLDDVADRAGLTIAWDRSAATRIDIQPNVYHDDIEFRSSYGGTVNALVPNVTIAANVDYWLRAVVEDLGANQGKVSVYWSTDGATFTQILETTGLSKVNGEAGVSTAGPNMPHAQFDDFSIVGSHSEPTEGIIAYYPFQGNAQDMSGNNHDGIVSGPTLTNDRFGNPDSAYSFDGIDDQIVVDDEAGDFNVFDGLTVSLWIKFHAQPVERVSFISKSSSAPNSGYIFPYYDSYAGGKIGLALHTAPCGWCDINNSYTYAQISQPLSWHLYTGTFDGRVRRLYIDGQLVSTDLQSDEPTSVTANTNDLVIGNQPDYPEWVNADLDDIRLYRRALSQAEIASLFGNFEPPPPVGLAWTQLAPVEAPSTRTGLGMVYDSFRSVVVAFGGCGDACSDTTWEYDGVNWLNSAALSGPTTRYRPALAYDSDRHVTVLFGGSDVSGVWLNDTWEYDGSNWVQRQPATSPPVRNGASMAYDSVRHRMVLFGGYDVGGWAFYNDTWEYDGQNWVQRAPSAAPSPRETAGMVYAQHLGKTILFGGGDSAGSTMHNDTWAWDGENWEQIVTVSAPSVRWGVNMTYDSTRQKVVLFGGVQGYGTGLNDTWEFNGSDWQQVDTLTTPGVRWDVGLAYDTERKQVVLFGGGNWNGPNYERFADTWVYSP